MTSKKCTRCGIDKSLEEFSFHKTGPGQRNSRCKKCVVLTTREWCKARAKASGSIKCAVCKAHKPSKDFYSGNATCKKCVSLWRMRRRIADGPPKVYRICETKECSSCRRTRDLSDFHANKWQSDGKNSVCKDCNRRGEYGPFLCSACNHLKSRVDFRISSRFKVRTECEDCEKTVLRCPKCGMLKTHSEFSPDKKLVTKRKSFCRSCESAHRKTELGRASRARRKARRRAREGPIESTLTAKEWRDILGAYDNRCAYCGLKFDEFHKPTQDHFVPLSRGGPHIKDNIVPACLACNTSKFTAILSSKPLPINPSQKLLFTS